MMSTAHYIFLIVAALVFSPCVHAAEEPTSTYVAKLSCTSGPYRIKLPKSYKALRALAPLKREKTLAVRDLGTHQAYERELRFAGLELVVITYSNKPDQYLLSRASLSSPKWKIGGQLRIGSQATSALRGMPIKEIPKNAELELNGDADSIHVAVSGGRVQEVDYECYTG